MRKLFVNLSALLLLCSLGATCSRAETGAAPAAADSASAAANHKIIVYYLYFTPRCETCINMETFAGEAVETGFAGELKQGLVEWHSYDTGDKAYEHYWDDFKLETKALIMVEERGGRQVRWKNCDKIWDLVGAKPDFLKYVQDEVRGYLSGK